MPSLEEMDLTEDAVYWERYGTEGSGNPILLYPEQISCRWVQKRRQVVDSKGQTVATDVDMATCCELLVGSIVWLGAISDITGTAEPPTPTEDLHEVISFTGCKDVKGLNDRREYHLQRWHGVLPTVVDVLE